MSKRIVALILAGLLILSVLASGIALVASYARDSAEQIGSEASVTAP